MLDIGIYGKEKFNILEDCNKCSNFTLVNTNAECKDCYTKNKRTKTLKKKIKTNKGRLK